MLTRMFTLLSKQGFKAAVKAQKQLAVPIYAAHGTKDKTTSLSVSSGFIVSKPDALYFAKPG